MDLSNIEPKEITPLSFAEVTVGDELAERKYPITRGDLVNYAGVANDPNPIHFSDTFAKKADLPGVIAHGMLVMGLVADYIADWLGDPAGLVDYAVRFSNPVVVPTTSPAELTVNAKVKKVDPENKTAELLLTVTVAGTKVLSKSTAVVKLR